MNTKVNTALAMLVVAAAFEGATISAKAADFAKDPITLIDQGSFAFGGSVRTEPGTFDPKKPLNPAGQTYHGDHGYAFYQTPANPKKYPVVMWHGAGQFSKTWEATPDGREGFQTIFLRRGFKTYVVDQPRRGDAGRSMVESTVKPTADEQMWFNQFRLGVWPKFFDGVQFDQDPQAMDQYFRQMTPNTGPFDSKAISDAGAKLFDRIGDGILFTHSQGGGPGWEIGMKSEHVKAIVSFEPGSSFVFPEGEVPADMPSSFDTIKGVSVPLADFEKLTKFPIVIYYGDNIPDAPSDLPGQDSWRVRLAMARQFAATINKHGGDASVVHLPEVGIRGNTHFAFSDLNNVQIADLVTKWLSEKKLD